MFGLFRQDPIKKLQKKYEKLNKEAFELSRTNRKLSDAKYAEAEAVIVEIKKLQEKK